MVASGMASIQESAKQQITQIDAEKQASLGKLNVKFASADTAKSSFGFIGIICVAVLFGGFLLNDFLKLGYYIYTKFKITPTTNNQTKEDIVSDDKDVEKGKDINQKIDEMYSQQLDDRLERIHLRLLQAKYSASKPNSRKLDNSVV